MSTLERFLADERAVEGLPVRLVIAVVVGVATLGVMLNMVSGIGGLGVSELDVRPSPDVVGPGSRTVALTVVDADGEPVAGATVVVRGDTATLDGVVTARTDRNGTATVTIAPRLRRNQAQGSLAVLVKPPPGSSYVDERANTAILVVREG